MKRKYLLLFVFLCLATVVVVSEAGAWDSGLLADLSPIESYEGVPNRNLEEWKTDIAQYSLRHYGRYTYSIEPSAIILHYTASREFPFNLLTSRTFQDEAPGVASHFVVQQTEAGTKIYQLLPLDIMNRATFGANFCSISIEMVALDEADLLAKKDLLETTISLVREIMTKYRIPLERIYGHEEVDRLLAEDFNGVFFDKTIQGNFVPRKVDPGRTVMKIMRERLQSTTPEQDPGY